MTLSSKLLRMKTFAKGFTMDVEFTVWNITKYKSLKCKILSMQSLILVTYLFELLGTPVVYN